MSQRQRFSESKDLRGIRWYLVLAYIEIILITGWWFMAGYGAWTLLKNMFGGAE